MNFTQDIYYPPEWHPQELVELAWPDEYTDWKDIMPEVQTCYIEIVSAIAEICNVLLLCRNPESLKPLFQNNIIEKIIFAEIEYNDTWARDFGGITIFRDNHPEILDFTFNGWGMKFASFNDNLTNRRLKEIGAFADTPLINRKNTVLEGGSLETDGNGTLMTTKVCLCSPNRNDEWGCEEIEAMLKTYLGIKNILWLKNGLLTGDDTDGHIDTLARFAPGNKIIYCKCLNPEDEHYSELQKMEDELSNFKNIDGINYELCPVPLPSALFDGSDRLPATYVNYLILNKHVLVPVYGQPEDKIALDTIASAHPGYTIIGINCLPLIKQHGSLHCITMNYPKGTFRNL